MELLRKLNSNRVLDYLFFLFTNVILYLIRFMNSFSKNKSGIVLIVSFHKLGDSVFTIPAVKELVNYYKNNNVIILTFPECTSIYRIVFKEIEIVSIERKEFKFNSRIASFKARGVIRKISPEIIFDLTGSIISSFLLAQSHATRIIGLNQKYYKSIYSDYVPTRHSPDLMDRYLDVVRVIKDIEKPEEIKTFPVSYNKSGRIYLNPFAGWKAKEWSIRKFVQLAEDLNQSFPVNFICEKGQITGTILNEIEYLKIPVIYTESVSDLIKAIDDCALFIGNDTGPLHIANLRGKPTYAIFGPTSVRYPYIPGPYHRFIQRIIPCSPVKTQYCFTNAGRLCPAYECMNNLSVEEVKSDIRQFINELGLETIKSAV